MELQPLTVEELLGMIGDREVELAQYRRLVGQLQARVAELEAEREAGAAGAE